MLLLWNKYFNSSLIIFIFIYYFLVKQMALLKAMAYDVNEAMLSM